MNSDLFFKKKKISLGQIFKQFKNKEDFIIKDIKPLHLAVKITFLIR